MELKALLFVLLTTTICTAVTGLRCYKCYFREFDPSGISQPECLTNPRDEWVEDVPDINPPSKSFGPNEEPPYWYPYCRVVSGGVEGRKQYDRSYAYRIDDVSGGPDPVHCDRFNMTGYVASYCYCNTDLCNNF